MACVGNAEGEADEFARVEPLVIVALRVVDVDKLSSDVWGKHFDFVFLCVGLIAKLGGEGEGNMRPVVNAVAECDLGKRLR